MLMGCKFYFLFRLLSICKCFNVQRLTNCTIKYSIIGRQLKHKNTESYWNSSEQDTQNNLNEISVIFFYKIKIDKSFIDPD